jgi:hypothetical protein
VSLHFFCDCEAQIVSRFKHLGHHFLKLGDCQHLYQQGIRATQKGENGRSAGVTVVSTLKYPILQSVQLESGPYFNMSNLFTKIYNML